MTVNFNCYKITQSAEYDSAFILFKVMIFTGSLQDLGLR